MLHLAYRVSEYALATPRPIFIPISRHWPQSRDYDLSTAMVPTLGRCPFLPLRLSFPSGPAVRLTSGTIPSGPTAAQVPKRIRNGYGTVTVLRVHRSTCSYFLSLRVTGTARVREPSSRVHVISPRLTISLRLIDDRSCTYSVFFLLCSMYT